MRHQIIKLLADNKAAKPRSQVRATGNEAVIYIYDAIVATEVDAMWFGGVAAETLVKEIRALKVDTIHLRINSPGGDVFAGRAIEQALRETSAKIIAHIDGFAASAASFVMLAADEIEMAPGAFIMIHNAWTIAMGNASDISKTVALLEKVDQTIVDSYQKFTGQKVETIIDWMAAETWFTAQEAIDAGFATRIADEDVNAAAPKWNLSAYDHPPAPAAEETPAPKLTPAPAAIPATSAQPEQQKEALVEQPAAEAPQASLLRRLQLATATA